MLKLHFAIVALALLATQALSFTHEFCLRYNVDDANDAKQKGAKNVWLQKFSNKFGAQFSGQPFDYDQFNSPKLDFIDQCKIAVTYQHGHMTMFGLPSFDRATTTDVLNNQRAVNSETPERLVYKLIERNLKHPDQESLVYLAQCSELMIYDTLAAPPTTYHAAGSHTNWAYKATPADYAANRKNFMDKSKDRLDLWSVPCSAATKNAVVFVVPGTKSVSRENGDGYLQVFMDNFLPGPHGGRGLLASVDAVNQFITAENDEKNPGVQLLCREPVLNVPELKKLVKKYHSVTDIESSGRAQNDLGYAFMVKLAGLLNCGDQLLQEDLLTATTRMTDGRDTLGKYEECLDALVAPWNDYHRAAAPAPAPAPKAGKKKNKKHGKSEDADAALSPAKGKNKKTKPLRGNKGKGKDDDLDLTIRGKNLFDEEKTKPRNDKGKEKDDESTEDLKINGKPLFAED